MADVAPDIALLDRLLAAALAAVSADIAMPAQVPAAPPGRLTVIAAGKAAAAMMATAQRRGGPLPGLVVTAPGHVRAEHHWPGVTIVVAGHPVPDTNSVAAAEQALAIAAGLGVNDQLLVLLSGGASALLALPVAGVTLDDKQMLTRALLQSGATIAEINTVRRQLSRIKGGRLAAAAAPAVVTTWIISDVPGDDPALVGSGPTIADTATQAMARAIIARHGIVPPPAVAAALTAPQPAEDRDAPDPLNRSRIIARARDALDAAGTLARASGYRVHDLGDDVQGLAGDVASQQAGLALTLAARGGQHAIISGGETTVLVNNPAGRGGRNREYLLALAIALDGAPGISALACDTDGIDGNDSAAGARIGPDTLARARALGLDAGASLAGNNAGAFFAALGDLVITGPTLTNVNDLRVILIDAGRG
ncbi:MAG: hypothetical protein RL490_2323 [Pseudomonadota bacterium]|jgi:hydroxypyruvate reductase